MPNHVHGIVIISQKPCRGEACLAPTNLAHTNRPPSLGNVIGSFKSAASKKIRKNGNPDFCWLRRYHDHIIRDDVERILIDRYIRDNPRRYGGSPPPPYGLGMPSPYGGVLLRRYIRVHHTYGV